MNKKVAMDQIDFQVIHIHVYCVVSIVLALYMINRVCDLTDGQLSLVVVLAFTVAGWNRTEE